MDGYVRRTEPGAPGARLTAVRRWKIAKWIYMRGWRLGQVFEDLAYDTDDDPRLREALERIESGESSGIVIVRLHQIGDSLAQAVDAIERIRAAGGAFASVCDGIDLSTPTGQRILRLLVSVTEWERPAPTKHDPTADWDCSGANPQQAWTGPPTSR